MLLPLTIFSREFSRSQVFITIVTHCVSATAKDPTLELIANVYYVVLRLKRRYDNAISRDLNAT